MSVILPRVIYGNRGDLASRWGLLRALEQIGLRDVTVFRHLAGDVPPLPYCSLQYRPLRNLSLDKVALKAFRQADTVLWAVGLDMQDDSSLVRLLYLWVTFCLYRLLGLRIICLFQGAGPITTPVGKMLARAALEKVETFVARDPGTFALIKRINPRTNCILAHDAIFLPGLEDDISLLSPKEHILLDGLFANSNQAVVGLNIRQWFHFRSSILPYQLARQSYRKRSERQMQQVIRAAAQLIEMLRQHRARVLLISAYQPDIVPWEDDLPWLEQVKDRFTQDSEVVLVNMPLSIPAYFALMSRLDLMIGMRLHSSLIALRYGIPAVNLSYTLKGGDILTALNLKQNVIELNDFLQTPQAVYTRVASILSNLPAERQFVRYQVSQAVETNMRVLRGLFGVLS